MRKTSLLLALWSGVAAAGFVELHAHLFMRHGLSPLFRGDFFDGVRATGPGLSIFNQTDLASLNASGATIVVVTLYAHPVLKRDLREAIRAQIADAERVTQLDPKWMIAKSPAEARKALARGQRALVLSLETAHGVLETEADMEEFVDRRGIKIVTPIHLTDDELGGAAFMGGILNFFNPIAFLPHLLESNPENPQGLTLEGRTLVQNLLRHGVWIDSTHAGTRAWRDLREMLDRTSQVPLFTHQTLRRFKHTERTLSDEQIAWVKARGGIVGLMASQDYLGSVPGLEDRCQGTARALRAHYDSLAQAIGRDSVMFGSDWNGGIRHLRFGCTGGQAPSIQDKGLYHLGQLTELASDLGASERMDEAFLKAWEKAISSPKNSP